MGSTDTWKRQGKYLFASGKYDEAVKCLNRVIQQEPEDEEAWLFKGRSLHYQHKHQDAIKCYERIIALNQKNEDAWAGIAQSSDKLVDQSPKSADAWDLKIGALIKLGRHEEAAESFEKAMSKSPDLILKTATKIWNWKGDSLRAQRKYEEAIKFYNKTLKQDPQNEIAWVNKAKALYLLGKPVEAVMCCDKALEIDEKDAKVWAIKSVALKAVHRYDEAEAAIEKARKLGYRE